MRYFNGLLVLLCHKICRRGTAEWASLEPLSDVRSDAPAQRGDRVSHVALRALGSRVARSPRVSQMCRGSQRFFYRFPE